MVKINRESKEYGTFKDLSDEIQYCIKQKGYDPNYNSGFTLPFISIECTSQDRSKGYCISETSFPIVFCGDAEIKKGEKKINELAEDKNVIEISVESYTYKKS